MAPQEGSQTISLKVLIDKENNRVVMVEADSDFVDILLSFMTMPMGTIVRLINKQPHPVTIGSMTSLYKWVENVDEQLLQTEACKSLLLHPRNAYEIECRKLKLNIDDTEPTKYYICADWNCSRRITRLYTTIKNVKCNCGKMLDKEIGMAREDVGAGSEGDGGVFVCGTTKYMVTDDLQVEPISPITIVALLHKLGLKDTNSFQETTLSIGSEEILNLLKGSLSSKTPLTDVFLKKQGFTSSEALKFEIEDALQSKSGSDLFRFPREIAHMKMKLMIRKSMNKALHAEAGEGMVNLLLSYLTLPLGSILQLLDGNSSLGSMGNLYNSVSRVTRADSIRDLLLQPGLCPGSYNPLGVKEKGGLPNHLWITSYKNPENKDVDNPYTSYLSTTKQDNHGRTSEYCSYIENKSPPSVRASQGGFLKRPANFMVMDNMVFKPLVSSWNLCLSFLKKETEIPLDDLEVLEINVGWQQALKLLKAYLFSKSVPIDALQSIFNFELKSPKQEEK